LASRRRRVPPRQTGQDRRTQPTLPQGPPGPTEASISQPALITQPALIKGRISTAAAVDDDLHYKTGLMGRLAQFFVGRRAAGDPYDETLVLPALIVIVV